VQFENPWMLLGMGAAAIPIILHLINRRRAEVVPFAAIGFLLRSDKRLARRLRLRQILVLLLRVLLIAAIPFAMSRPFMTPDSGWSPRPATSVILVVDNSASMSAAYDSDSHLDAAIAQARALVRELGPESNLAIVAASWPARTLSDELLFDHNEIHRQLSELKQRSTADDLKGALQIAESLLSGSTLEEREIVLFTDGNAASFENLRSPWSMTPPPHVEIVDVSPANIPRYNAAVSDVQVEPALEVSRQHVRVQVHVTAHGDTPFRGLVSIALGERTLENSLEVPPGETRMTTFLVKLDANVTLEGEARIGEDPLLLDNVRPFSIHFARPVQLLIVNGAARTVPWRDELFFLQSALNSTADALGARVHVRKAEEVTSSDIEHSDVIVLANVRVLPGDLITTMRTRVEQGAGLLFTAGDNLTIAHNAAFGDLLPAPIRAVKSTARGRHGSGDTAPFLQLDRVDLAHPIFDIFAHVADASLFKARFHTHLLLDTAPTHTQVLASYRGGAPFLVERSLGAGRTLLLTTTVDQDWGDLPLKSSFVPFIATLVDHLAHRTDPLGAEVPEAGQLLLIPIPPGTAEVVVQSPDGIRHRWIPTRSDTASEIRHDATDLPGIHRVEIRSLTPESKVTTHLVGVVVPADESRTERFDPVHAANTMASGETLRASSPHRPLTSDQDSQRTRIWPLILLALFALLGSEAAVIVRS